MSNFVFSFSDKFKKIFLISSASFGLLFAFPALTFMVGKNMESDKVSVVVKEVEVPLVVEKPIEITKGVPLSNINLMANTVFYEAQSESYVGHLAVAHVIKNRYNFDKSCDSIAEVVKERWQFTMWEESDVNSDKAEDAVLNPHEKSDFEQKNYAIAWKASYDVLTGESKDMTYGATMYLNPKRVDKIPKWYKECQDTIQIGNHHFCYYDMEFCDRGK